MRLPQGTDAFYGAILIGTIGSIIFLGIEKYCEWKEKNRKE